MPKLVIALSLLALAGCSNASQPSSQAATPAPTGIRASTGGGMQVVDPQSYRNTIGTTQVR